MKFYKKQYKVAENRRPPHGGRGLKFGLALIFRHMKKRRPPHGGRGLKFFIGLKRLGFFLVALPTEGVD